MRRCATVGDIGHAVRAAPRRVVLRLRGGARASAGRARRITSSISAPGPARCGATPSSSTAGSTAAAANVELERAGLYPEDGRAGLIAGTLVPVNARVQAVPDDFTERPSAIYRRRLSAADYARLQAKVARMRDNERAWHMMMFNCNDFGIAIAHELGLDTPPAMLVPNAWVRALTAMNERIVRHHRHARA